jgi:hypothetical protein
MAATGFSVHSLVFYNGCTADGHPRSPLDMAEQILQILDDMGYLRWVLPAAFRLSPFALPRKVIGQ